MIELSTCRDELRGDADLLAAHLVAQRERVGASGSEALREVLARPTILRAAAGAREGRLRPAEARRARGGDRRDRHRQRGESRPATTPSAGAASTEPREADPRGRG